MEKHRIVKIKKIIKENQDIKTFFLDCKINYKPGQFIMLWIPGVDEKPFSLSYTKSAAVTVEKKGIFTEKLFKMKAGDKIGIRGPYGNGFKLKSNAVVVAGGCGYAPLAPLIEKLKKPTVIFGCQTKKKIIFKNRFKKLKPNLCTDDGSFGFKGFTSNLLEEMLKCQKYSAGLVDQRTKSAIHYGKRNISEHAQEPLVHDGMACKASPSMPSISDGRFLTEKKFKIVYTCGPEIMMKKIFDICEKNKIEMQASLERYIKCGFGVCGSCACGPFLVCKDGPVFNSKQLRQMKDFGKYAKLKSGKKATLKKFYGWRSR